MCIHTVNRSRFKSNDILIDKGSITFVLTMIVLHELGSLMVNFNILNMKNTYYCYY
jgi:hypothetical protein